MAVLLRVKRFHSCSKSKELPPFLFEFLLRDRTYIQQRLVCPKLLRDILRRRRRLVLRVFRRLHGLRLALRVLLRLRGIRLALRVLLCLRGILLALRILPRLSSLRLRSRLPVKYRLWVTRRCDGVHLVLHHDRRNNGKENSMIRHSAAVLDGIFRFHAILSMRCAVLYVQ